MTFNSYSFIFIYLPVFLAVLYLIQIYVDKKSADKVIRLWIIAMSALFFVFFGMRSICVFALSIVANTIFAKIISEKKKGLPIAVVFNVSLLCLFKYSANPVMPVAISFYTFQQIAFLTELKRGNIKDFSLLNYLSYILFFPKILQGPLSEYDNLNRQIASLSEKKINSEGIMDGLYLFALGLFKKVLLSDVLGKAVDFGYGNVASLTALDAVIVAISYSFQLYFDFSGYCDMAEGVCRMMGIELQMNFNAPYIAKNISDFWDRWHISLTKFFTKYVYIPLGGSRRGVLRTYLNILIVFFISGIWHGKGLTFIIWGMMHGVMMVLTRAIVHPSTDKDKSKNGPNKNKPLGAINVIQTALTFIYVTAAWVFFRAPSVNDAALIIKKCATGISDYGLHISIELAECFQLDELWYVFKVTPIPSWNKSGYLCMWIILVVSALFIFSGKTASNMADKFAQGKNGILKTVFISIIFVWSVLSLGGVSTFLYVNF